MFWIIFFAIISALIFFYIILPLMFTKGFWKLTGYLILIIMGIGIIVYFWNYYDQRSHKIVDKNDSFIVCDNGKKYKTGENGIDATGASAGQYGGVNEQGENPAKVRANILCLTGKTDTPDFLTDEQMNKIQGPALYKVEMVKE